MIVVVNFDIFLGHFFVSLVTEASRNPSTKPYFPVSLQLVNKKPSVNDAPNEMIIIWYFTKQATCLE